MSQKTSHRFKLLNTSLACTALLYCSNTYADDEFNLEALGFGSPISNTESIRTFLKNNALEPGVYLTTVYFNNVPAGKRKISYVLNGARTALIPVLTKDELRQYGVNVDVIPAFKDKDDNVAVGDLATLVEDATYLFNPQIQRLDIRVPQIAVNQKISGYIDPVRWDDGITAASLNYYYSGSQTYYTASDADNREQNYLFLTSGLNVGPWRLRNSSNYQSTSGWETISTSLYRDITMLRSQLTVGDTSTASDVFDSLPFRGIRLQTDTDMLPYSQQGFAPVIRGIAQSDSTVTVKQNGYTVYQTYVTAGAFEITDIPQVSSGGDLEVTIIGADGREQQFIQSSSSLPIMQREGALTYSLSMGRYQSNDITDTPFLSEAQAIYGLPWGVTLYGGLLGSDFYRSAALGLGLDLHTVGSLSFDATRARSEINGAVYQGMSYRTQYAKNIDTTNTNLTLASYRYSTRNFYTFTEAINQLDDAKSDDFYAYRSNYNRRSRLQVNVSQSLNGFGTFYLSGYQQDYWGLDGTERTYSVGYNTTWKRTNISVSYAQTQTPSAERDQRVALTVSVPLDQWLPGAWANYSTNSQRNGPTTHQVGLSGSTLADNNLSYNIQQSWATNGGGENGSLSGTFRGTSGTANAGYRYDNRSQQIHYSLQGGVIAHAGGLTLAQSIPETVTLVSAKGAAGVNVANGSGIYTDSRGYAVLPYGSPYRVNTVTLTTAGSRHVDIQQPVLETIPTRGAITQLIFSPRIGRRVMLTLINNHTAVPFGAIATVNDEREENQSSIVGDNGQLYLAGVKNGDRLRVRWGQEAHQQCYASITLPEEQSDSRPVFLQTMECQS